MTWFKVDDGFWRHRKVRKLGTAKVAVPARVAAAGLWVLAGDWSADTGSDGFVPNEQLETWDPKHQLARRLVQVDLWHETEVDGEHGYQFHQWDERQPLNEQVVAQRLKRAEAGRLGGLRSRQSRSKPEANASANAQPPASSNSEANGTARARSKNEPRPVPSRPVVPAGHFEGGTSGWQTRDDPPPPRCPKHLDNPTDQPCRACGDARRARETWDRDQAAAKAAVAAELERARADPRLRCEHGTDGGRHRRSDNGQSPCALCRKELATQRKDPA